MTKIYCLGTGKYDDYHIIMVSLDKQVILNEVEKRKKEIRLALESEGRLYSDHSAFYVLEERVLDKVQNTTQIKETILLDWYESTFQNNQKYFAIKDRKNT